MNRLKRIILKSAKIRDFRDKGYFNRAERRNLMLFYFFKFLFGLNRESRIPINFTSQIICPERIKLGLNVNRSFLVSGGCYYQGINGIFIDDNTIIGPGVKIISANHSVSNIHSHSENSAIHIGKNCWLGSNVIILPGVVLGDNTIVAAGAVVSKSCKKGNTILKGVPAK